MPETGRRGSKDGAGDGEVPSGWYSLVGAGFEFIVAVLLFGWLGWLVDGWLGSAPWWMIVGGGFGFVVGLSILWKLAKRTFRD